MQASARAESIEASLLPNPGNSGKLAPIPRSNFAFFVEKTKIRKNKAPVDKAAVPR
jgi:hypothetical protein